MRPLLALLLLVLAPGCTPDRPAEEAPPGPPLPAPVPAAAALPREWESAPRDGVRLRAGDTLRVQTGPHVVLWPAGAEPLSPPYTVRATLRKPSGRLHEGYGVVIGGSRLDAPEEAQRYSYFLVRGDGSFLIKRRAGAETPVVRPWTSHHAVRRDTDEGGEPNELVVEVGEAEVAFRVNGAEVARVPAAELDTHGVAGIRAAHQVQLEVTRFGAVPDSVAAVPQGEPLREGGARRLPAGPGARDRRLTIPRGGGTIPEENEQ
jgi:hypothetical protein